MEYTHSRLELDQIRLLQIADATPHNLRFNVVHVSRTSAPPYTALSYTWGDEKAEEDIYLDGKDFLIRRNLWSALHYLIPFSRMAGWKHIWVDAICIDQDNDSERNVQVKSMDATYREAAVVSVWLGLMPGWEQYRYRSLDPVKTFDIESFDWKDYMEDLANRPYWSRIWVIQEFLLASDVALYCSGSLVDYQDFKMLMELPSTTASATADDPHLASSFVAGRHPDKHPDFAQSLHDLVESHAQAECGNPRDRIFALLGLISDLERSLLQRFLPDYSLTSEEVITIAFAHMTQYSHRDTVLSNKVYQGLGIRSERQKAKLLRRAKDFNYAGCTTRDDFLAQMAVHYENEQARLYASNFNLDRTGTSTDAHYDNELNSHGVDFSDFQRANGGAADRSTGLGFGRVMSTLFLVVGAFMLGKFWAEKRRW
jgi:hypothetical protein